MWPRVVGNRYTIVLGLIAVGTAAWNLYVIRHDQGRVEGRVLDAGGRPVAGATVALYERTLTTLEPRGSAETDGEGRFRFGGQPAHHLVLEAKKAGSGQSPRTRYCQKVWIGRWGGPPPTRVGLILSEVVDQFRVMGEPRIDRGCHPLT